MSSKTLKDAATAFQLSPQGIDDFLALVESQQIKNPQE
jgi:hypothetical protein